VVTDFAFAFCAAAWRRTSSKIAAPFPIKPVAMLEALKRLNGRPATGTGPDRDRLAQRFERLRAAA